MNRGEVIEYYSRPEIAKEILRVCKNREIVGVLENGAFGSRPNVLYYENDIKALVRDGAISFHASVERWSNPLMLKKESKLKELDELRTGWDLIIDIDCDEGLDYSKKATLVMAELLEKYGIKNYSIKFSGNRGFHLGVSFDSFPKEIVGQDKTAKHYPRYPKIILEYLSQQAKPLLDKEFGRDSDKILKFDTAVITSRHLIRLPYCIHRKTGLVSVPISKDQVEGFEKDAAKPENVKPNLGFLDMSEKNEGLGLLQGALFWDSRRQQEKKKEVDIQIQLPMKAITPDKFPPCIKNILNGIKDGKKRSIFALVGFLHHCGWNRNDIEATLLAWNKKNPEELDERTIKAGIKHQYSRQEGPQMCPNCDNINYFKGYGVCTPDNMCATLKNPVSYAKRKARMKKKRKPRRKVNKSKDQQVKAKNG
jgi:DNA primase catalytic subunit